MAEDVRLLLSQSERCREILAAAGAPSRRGRRLALYRLPISALVEAAGALYRDERVRLIFAIDRRAGQRRAAGPPQPGDHARPQQPDPERGAVRPARGQRDDRIGTSARSRSRSPMTGRAFRRTCLGRLGEPYLSTRAGASNHMGLGIFIAQSLLERSGADLDLRQPRRRRRTCCHFLESCQFGGGCAT